MALLWTFCTFGFAFAIVQFPMYSSSSSSGSDIQRSTFVLLLSDGLLCVWWMDKDSGHTDRVFVGHGRSLLCWEMQGQTIHHQSREGNNEWVSQIDYISTWFVNDGGLNHDSWQRNEEEEVFIQFNIQSLKNRWTRVSLIKKRETNTILCHYLINFHSLIIIGQNSSSVSSHSVSFSVSRVISSIIATALDNN